MFRRVACAILLAGAMHAPPAMAGLYITGNDLYGDCSVPKDNPVYYTRTERCTGYITGVVDATEGTRQLQGRAFCVPDNVTLGQVTETVSNYLKAHADTRSLNASALVIAAMTETWSCEGFVTR
jgi:hypothetical protein